MTTLQLYGPIRKNVQHHVRRFLSTAAGDVGLMTLCNLLNNAVSFITSAAIAAVLTAEEFGVFSVSVNVTMIIFGLSEAGLSLSLVRHYSHEKNSEARRDILRTGAILRVTIALLLLTLALPLGWALSLVLSSDRLIRSELAIGVIAAGSLGLWATARATQQATQNYRQYALLTFIYGVTRFLIVGVFYLTGMRDAVYYLAALYMISPLITAVGFYRTFHREYHIAFDVLNIQLVKSLFAYGRWVLASTFLSPLCYSLPLFLLMSLRGAADAAPYGLALMFSAVVGPLGDAIGIYLVPKVTSFSSPQDVRSYIRHVIKFLGAFVALVAVVISIVSAIYSLLYMNKYPDGLLITQLLLGANFLASYGGILNCITHYFGSPHLNMLANLGKILMCGGGALILIPHFGAQGAALAAAVAAVVGETGLFFALQYRLSKLKLA